MTTKKKIATTTEAAMPAVKAAPVKKTTTTEVKAKATPTAAATHKAPARKSATPKAEVKAATKPAFDENSYRAEIEIEAYLMWESRGGSHGQAHEDWLRAVEIVRARNA